MQKVGILVIGLLLVSVAVIGCAQPAPSVPSTPSTPTQQPAEEGVVPETDKPPQETVSPADKEMPLTLTSPAFTDGSKIPVKYTCDGGNTSPPLNWGKGPAGTASFVLIVDDTNAPVGVFTHWVIFNLPPDTQGLPEAVPQDDKLASGALQGKNGAQLIGYFGPCPPGGTPHHYRFTLYALDKSLSSKAGAEKEQVLQAMQQHIIGQAQLIGTYR